MGIDVGMGVRISGLQSRPEWNGRLATVIGAERSSEDGTPRFPVLIDGDNVEVAQCRDGVLLKASCLTLLPREMLDLLLEAKADVNDSNQITGNDTVLHEAARTGD